MTDTTDTDRQTGQAKLLIDIKVVCLMWIEATTPTTSNDGLTRPSNITSVPVSDPSHKSWGLGVKESHIGNLTTSSGAPRQ